MQKITINGTEYKIKYGFNCFADTDLLEKVGEISSLLSDSGASSDNDVNQLGKIKDLFTITRELLYVGFNKYNPLKSITECGDLIDEWHDEAGEEETRGLIDLFSILASELTNEGFLADLMSQEPIAKIPQDHKRKMK